MPHSLSHCLAAALLVCTASSAVAQATVKQDGRWHSTLGAGLTNSTGNTRASSVTLNGDAVRARPENKWSISGQLLYAKSEGVTSGNQIRMATRYDWNLTPVWFTFAGGNAARDPIAELSRRLSLSGGLGYRVLNLDDKTFNVFGGIEVTDERYTQPRFVDGATRDQFSYSSFLFGEESTHTLTETVSARQRLVAYPNMRNRGAYRLEFDAGLSVAMTRTLSLNVGFTARRDSDPGPGVKRDDTLRRPGCR